ncbi:MAG: hypothetical protein ACLTA7_10570 [Ruminococcus sp.]
MDIDFFDVQLEEKNRILLCSDGLSNMVADEEIQKILGIHRISNSPADIWWSLPMKMEAEIIFPL